MTHDPKRTPHEVTWLGLITRAMQTTGDSPDDIRTGENGTCSLTSKELVRKFQGKTGAEHGVPFVLWTKDWVYFSVSTNGYESVGCVPRNPRSGLRFTPKHFGG